MQFRNEYYFLSNMYPHDIAYGGHTFTCVEAAFQAQKQPEKARMFEGLDGFAAKKLGSRRSGQITPTADWDRRRIKVMQDLIDIKFEDPDLSARLKKVTGPIVEDNTWGDTFWGKCRGKGNNMLGKMLSDKRQRLLSAEPASRRMPTEPIAEEDGIYYELPFTD